MIPYDLIAYDMISYDLIAYDMIALKKISYDMTSYDIIWYHIISYDIISYDIIWWHMVEKWENIFLKLFGHVGDMIGYHDWSFWASQTKHIFKVVSGLLGYYHRKQCYYRINSSEVKSVSVTENNSWD